MQHQGKTRPSLQKPKTASSLFEKINSRCPRVSTTSVKVGWTNLKASVAQKAASPPNADPGRLVRVFPSTNFHVGTDARRELSQLLRKVRAQFRGAKTHPIVRRMHRDQVGGPRLKLCSRDDLPRVLLQVIKLPRGLVSLVNIGRSTQHENQGDKQNGFHGRRAIQRIVWLQGHPFKYFRAEPFSATKKYTPPVISPSQPERAANLLARTGIVHLRQVTATMGRLSLVQQENYQVASSPSRFRNTQQGTIQRRSPTRPTQR